MKKESTKPSPASYVWGVKNPSRVANQVGEKLAMNIKKSQLTKIIHEELYQILMEQESAGEYRLQIAPPIGGGGPGRGQGPPMQSEPLQAPRSRGQFGPMPAPPPLTDPEGLQPGIGPTGHSKDWMLTNKTLKSRSDRPTSMLAAGTPRKLT